MNADKMNYPYEVSRTLLYISNCYYHKLYL